jgi:multiple sugar transport system substrate-binding protein
MTTTLKFWLMPNSGFDSRQHIDQEIRCFHKIHPNIKIAYEIFSWTRAWSELMQAVKEKSGPDIIQVGTTWIGTLAYLGAVQKLEKRTIKSESFTAPLFNMCQSIGHLRAIPWFCEGRVLFYRKDHLEKAGLTAAALENWESFRKACDRIKKLKKGGPAVAPFGFSGLKEQGLQQDLASWVWGNNGDFLSADGKHCSLGGPEARLGFKYLLDLIASGCVSPSSLEQGAGEVTENFFIHDAYTFVLASSWPLQVFLNPEAKGYIGNERAKNFGVALVPAGGAGRYNFAGGSALAVTSFSRSREAAFSFLEFLTDRASLARYCRNINMLPCRQDIPATLTQDRGTQQIFRDSINLYGRSFPSHPLWGSIEQIIVSGFAQSLRNFRESGDRAAFFRNVSEMSQEIEYILSVFGD